MSASAYTLLRSSPAPQTVVLVVMEALEREGDGMDLTDRLVLWNMVNNAIVQVNAILPTVQTLPHTTELYVTMLESLQAQYLHLYAMIMELQGPSLNEADAVNQSQNNTDSENDSETTRPVTPNSEYSSEEHNDDADSIASTDVSVTGSVQFV
jgi:hypothetical protein